MLQAPAKIVGKAGRKKWRETYAGLEGRGGRVPVFSLANYFHAPATQANRKRSVLTRTSKKRSKFINKILNHPRLVFSR